jgi:transposase InsO family protein
VPAPSFQRERVSVATASDLSLAAMLPGWACNTSRLQADLPNECWQADFTYHRLADGTDAEILCWIDDRSRYALWATAHRRVTGPIVVDTFTTIIERHGVPSSTLTDFAEQQGKYSA